LERLFRYRPLSIDADDDTDDDSYWSSFASTNHTLQPNSPVTDAAVGPQRSGPSNRCKHTGRCQVTTSWRDAVAPGKTRRHRHRRPAASDSGTSSPTDKRWSPSTTGASSTDAARMCCGFLALSCDDDDDVHDDDDCSSLRDIEDCCVLVRGLRPLCCITCCSAVNHSTKPCRCCLPARRCQCLANPSRWCCFLVAADQCPLADQSPGMDTCCYELVCPGHNLPVHSVAPDCHAQLIPGCALPHCTAGRYTAAPVLCRARCGSSLMSTTSSRCCSILKSDSTRPPTVCCVEAQRRRQRPMQQVPVVCACCCVPQHHIAVDQDPPSKPPAACCRDVHCAVQQHPMTSATGHSPSTCPLQPAAYQSSSISGQSSSSSGSRVKSADQSKWKSSAEKRRISTRTAETGSASVESRSAATSTITTTAEPATTNAGVIQSKRQKVSQPRLEETEVLESTGVGPAPTNMTPTIPGVFRDRQPCISSELALSANNTVRDQRDADSRCVSLVPDGAELSRLVAAVASIDHDVRAMAAALQCSARDDSAATGRSSYGVVNERAERHHTVAGLSPEVSSAGGRTAAVALLLPSADPNVNHKQLVDHPAQATHMAADETTSTTVAGPKLSRDARAPPAARVKVLPGSNDVDVGTQSEQRRHALIPAANSKLPFRLATTNNAGSPTLVQNKHNNSDHRSRQLDGTTAASSVSPDSTFPRGVSSTDTGRPQQSPVFTDIRQIIRQLEAVSGSADVGCSGGTAAWPTSGSRPTDAVGARAKYHDRQIESGASHSQQKHAGSGGGAPISTLNCQRSGTDGSAAAAATTHKTRATSRESMPAPMLKSAGTSPLSVVQISTKQTQTSPKVSAVQSPPASAATLHDDKNATTKSRSLELQHHHHRHHPNLQLHQQQMQYHTSLVESNATPLLALPRASGTVTTATHSTAIPLPAPPALATPSAALSGGPAVSPAAEDPNAETQHGTAEE